MEALPEAWASLSDSEAVDRIAVVRKAFGEDLLLLGHHYQRDEVIRFADLTGDSYTLAKGAASRQEARFLVFCGVHFMAETARILAAPEQRVLLPDLEAGCSMADMADIDSVEVAWDEMSALRDPDGVIPVTYVNSAAAIKAFVGERGGAVCTSSNAGAVYDWALEKGKALFFLPDQHLGRNVGVRKGIVLENMRLWDPALENGGLDARDVREARVLLWKGHCQVHARFDTAQIAALRRRYPGARALVHWECALDVVEAADSVGSTADLVREVEKAPKGSVLGMGTELHLVARLAKTHPDKTIVPLVAGTCVCATMNRIDPQHLLFTLDELSLGRMVHEITVPETIAAGARLALDRMIEITGRATSPRGTLAAPDRVG